MSNVLDFNEKRIYELSLLDATRITDEALMIISQDSLTRSMKISYLREVLTASEKDGMSSNKFLTAKSIYDELNEVENKFITTNIQLSDFSNDILNISGRLDSMNSELDGKIENFISQFAEFKNYISGEGNGQIPLIKTEIEQFKSDIRTEFSTLTKDTDELIEDARMELQDGINGVNANVSYIYAYGPVVPTLLPEGKIFLQTFNVNYKNEDPQNYTKAVTSISSGNILNNKTVMIRVEAVGMKVVRLTLILPQLTKIPTNTSAIKVSLFEDHVLDKKGLVIYESIATSLTNTIYGIGVELGVFMIPTTSTTIEVSLGAGIYDEPTKVSFNHYDDGIWETVGGIIVIPLTTEIKNEDTGEISTVFLLNEEGDYLSASGSSDQNPKIN